MEMDYILKQITGSKCFKFFSGILESLLKLECGVFSLEKTTSFPSGPSEHKL